MEASAGENAVGAVVAEDATTLTFAAQVAYKGAAFCGFARQPGQLTVQGELEQALQLLFRREVPTVCAGRTDAGVHAIGQWVSFDIDEAELNGRTEASMLRSLNALTHDDIRVRALERRAPGFSARFDAVSREYRYFICTDATPSLFLADFSWHISTPLDVDAMRAGAAHLVGEHDFKSFCLAVSAEGKPTCRYVESIDVDRQTADDGSNLIVITVKGNAFLHSMVRTIVGTLVAVGRGKKAPDWVAEVLAARDRRAAGECAPAQGLVFWRVIY